MKKKKSGVAVVMKRRPAAVRKKTAIHEYLMKEISYRHFIFLAHKKEIDANRAKVRCVISSILAVLADSETNCVLPWQEPIDFSLLLSGRDVVMLSTRYKCTH